MNNPISLLIDSIITNLDKLKVSPNKFPDEFHHGKYSRFHNGLL